MAKSKGIAGKIVAGALALAVAVGSVSLLGYTSRDTKGNWFGGLHWADNNITADNNGGNTIVNEGESSGMRLMSTMIAAEDYDEYGVSALAESATIITATITPEAATNKAVTWSCSNTNGRVTVTPIEDTLQAIVTVLEPIMAQETITCTLQANSSIYATLTVDYVKGLNENLGPESISSIKDSMQIKSYIDFSMGTLMPTSIKGTTHITMQSDLYDYLISKGWSNIKKTVEIADTDEYYDCGLYGFWNLLNAYSDASKIFEDIAIFYYGKTNQNVYNVSWNDVTVYYGDTETSFYNMELIKVGVFVQNFNDITVNPTGLSLSDGRLIFGANGQVS